MAGVVITGFEQETERQAKVLKRAKDLKPAMEKVRIYMLTNALPKRWRAQVSHTGAAWKAVEDPKRKEKLGSARILFLKGDMQRSVASGPFSLTKTDKKSITIGTNMVYAATHQFGDPDRNIPARPWIGFSKFDIKTREEILVRYLLEGK